MKRKGLILLLGLVVILSGWWVTRSSSLVQPSESVVDVWVTWGDEADHLQSLFDRFGRFSGVPVQVTTRVKSRDLEKALSGTAQPDLVILSSSDLVGAYAEQGLVEPLDRWIRTAGIDLEDMFPAPLAQCRGLDGTYRCLPWGCDLDALFWNKDLFAAAGLDPERPPQTLEELAEYAQKLTVRDGEGGLSQVGFIPDLPRSHTGLYMGLFGGALHGDGGDELSVTGQPAVDTFNWQMQVAKLYAPGELEDFISSFTPYGTSRHAIFAGKRLDCQQCHRSSPVQSKKVPSAGFRQGRIAMIVDGQWQASLTALSPEENPVNYGLAPVPPSAAHPERASTTLVQGPVVIIPAGARDKEAAAHLLAWMASPEILAEAAYAHAMLPSSRTSAQDPRFRQSPNFDLFVDLLSHPNAQHMAAWPINSNLNEALSQVGQTLVQQGGDPLRLLDEVQAGLVPKLEKARAQQERP